MSGTNPSHGYAQLCDHTIICMVQVLVRDQPVSWVHTNVLPHNNLCGAGPCQGPTRLVGMHNWVVWQNDLPLWAASPLMGWHHPSWGGIHVRYAVHARAWHATISGWSPYRGLACLHIREERTSLHHSNIYARKSISGNHRDKGGHSSASGPLSSRRGKVPALQCAMSLSWMLFS